IHHDHDRSPSIGYLGRSSSGRGVDPVMECISCFGVSLVVIWNPKARLEYLFAMLGLDCFGWRSDCGNCRLRIAANSSKHASRGMVAGQTGIWKVAAGCLLWVNDDWSNGTDDSHPR